MSVRWRAEIEFFNGIGREQALPKAPFRPKAAVRQDNLDDQLVAKVATDE